MKIYRMIINVSMTIVLLCLMAYSLIGEMTHEVLGTLMFVLFTIHHILNRRWFGALLKGKYNAFRILQTGLVFLLIVSVLGSAVSGILLSNQLYTFLPRVSGTGILRDIHMVCAYLNLVLMSLHLGVHWNAMMTQMNNQMGNSTTVKRILSILGYCIAAYGIYVFMKRQIGDYLFLRMHFLFLDDSEPLIFFFIDYVAIMGLFVCIGHHLAKLVRGWSSQKNRKTELT